MPDSDSWVHYHSLQRSLLLQPNHAAQRPPNSDTANKELNLALLAKEQSDSASLPAFQGMRVINWFSAVIWAGD